MLYNNKPKHLSSVSSLIVLICEYFWIVQLDSPFSFQRTDQFCFSMFPAVEFPPPPLEDYPTNW